MADIAHLDDASEPISDAPAKRSANFALAVAKILLNRLIPDRDAILSFSVALFVLFLSVSLLLEETLASLGWGLVLSGYGIHAPTGLAMFLLVGTLATNRLRRPAPCRRPPSREDLDRAVEILDTQPNASAGLVRLGDKKVLFSDCGTAFIMYAQQGRSWVALFDPVGPRKAWAGLVVKFMEAARKVGCRAVFYQVSPDFLPYTVEAGLKPYKLGEQAVVDLTKFDLKGGAWLKLRRSINRAVRDGLEFSMIKADDVPGILDELLSVSRIWLEAQNAAEKGFSLGTFQPAYVATGPVAVIRLEGRIVAFANILCASSHGDAFIDLMRHIPHTHRGMMDLLFVRIMEHMKVEGFKTLNLGMAPLAGLSTHSKAPLWNHVGERIFMHGERFYNFRGVLAFKEKFDPEWHPRYLAVAGGGMPVVSILDVTMLIGGGLKGLLRR
ncbi:phosphatidylglycerol lysyltransferase domain-containing protein [Rhizobium terrae]|uniref:phosphatidylglycerol lysyltransferase domain-containing protein n=1 Tax=Rhizobium terrae TaxID=2171756 RepID=UPI000E3CA0C4|nr:phosphatidylglycerol lysyltransferase domain-containing protein [Rhizobium terrae]